MHLVSDCCSCADCTGILYEAERTTLGEDQNNNKNKDNEVTIKRATEAALIAKKQTASLPRYDTIRKHAIPKRKASTGSVQASKVIHKTQTGEEARDGKNDVTRTAIEEAGQQIGFSTLTKQKCDNCPGSDRDDDVVTSVWKQKESCFTYLGTTTTV